MARILVFKNKLHANSVKATRNSSIELLRIIAMLMIILDHHIFFSNPNVETLPPSIKQFAYVFLSRIGNIGVAIFFAISAWYLCLDEAPTIKKSLKKVWLLEREVLFYSLGLMFAFTLFDFSLLGKRYAIYSLAPTLTGMWWYVTSYVIFILIHPFITVGLKSLGRTRHAALCLVFFILWGLIAGMLPYRFLNLPYDFVGFIYLYVFISFYRWYMKDLPTRVGWMAVSLGLFLIISVMGIGYFSAELTGRSELRELSLYILDRFSTPVITIGLGAILIAVNSHFTNPVINKIASTTFGVYLFHTYPPLLNIVWNMLFGLSKFYDQSLTFVYSLTVTLLIFTLGLVCDLLRQIFFTLTVDRHKGRGFERSWQWLSRLKLLSNLRKYLKTLLKPIQRSHP